MTVVTTYSLPTRSSRRSPCRGPRQRIQLPRHEADRRVPYPERRQAQHSVTLYAAVPRLQLGRPGPRLESRARAGGRAAEGSAQDPAVRELRPGMFSIMGWIPLRLVGAAKGKLSGPGSAVQKSAQARLDLPAAPDPLLDRATRSKRVSCRCASAHAVVPNSPRDLL